jgi:PAS domain S-box-containing protein
MEDHLKILLLEDSETDAEIVQRFLKKTNPNWQFKIAMSKNSFLSMLDEFRPDLILSDNSMPQFSAAEALEIKNQRNLQIPFIMVSGTATEEFAAGMIKKGADDYLLKDRLARLPAAIDMAIRQKKSEREKLEAEKKNEESKNNLKAIFENTSEGFLLMDMNGIVKALNNRASKYGLLLGEKEIQIGDQLFDFIPSDKNTFFKESVSRVLKGERVQYERVYGLEDGNNIWIDFSINPVKDDGKIKGVCITGRDITEKKLIEQELVTQRVQEQKRITRAMIAAQEKERNRLGEELHDNINQILAGTKLYLGMVGNDNPTFKELIKYPIQLIDSSIEEIRSLCHRLVTPLKNINLDQMVQNLLDTLSQNTSIKTRFTYSLGSLILNDDLKLNIFRIIQEQVNNIVKYAKADHVTISITQQNKILYISIADDGVGFNVKSERKGIGISNMIDRIESYNGEIEIISNPGNGCTISIKIPC